jgi:hypothetical protein
VVRGIPSIVYKIVALVILALLLYWVLKVYAHQGTRPQDTLDYKLGILGLRRPAASGCRLPFRPGLIQLNLKGRIPWAEVFLRIG